MVSPFRGRPSHAAFPGGLIGRTRECRLLDALLDAVRAGQSRVLVVRGDAGIGKSALLNHLIEAASDFEVARAAGVESEMELPFAGLHQLCSSMLDRLDTLPAPQRDAASTAFGMAPGASPDRLLIGLAVLSLVSAVAEERPLLCIVDDAQWLDRESLQALLFVARRVLADQIALVFATREPSTSFAAFPDLNVVGLKDSDAQTLLDAVLHAPLDDRVRGRIVAETRGNPLALVEWTRGLSPAQLAGGFGTSAIGPLSGQIEASFRHRLAQLPELTQRFLTVAAAEPTGDPVVVWRASSSLELDVTHAGPAIEAALVDLGGRVLFRHPLVRSAAYNAASHDERQAVHRALADATDPVADPDRSAWHRALGSPGPDEEVAEALEQSAARARGRGGVAAAAALLERSVVLTVDPSRRAQRVLAGAEAHLDAGSYEPAASLLAAAEATPLDDMGRVRLDLMRARHAAYCGDVQAAPEMFLRASRRLETAAPALAGLSYLQAMAVATSVGDTGGGVDALTVARAAAGCPRSPEPGPCDWLVSGFSRLQIDGLAAAAPALRKGITGPTDTLGVDDVQLLGFRTAAANLLWDVDALHRFAAAHVALTRSQGSLTMLPVALNSLAHVLVLEGELDAAASALTEATQIEASTASNLAIQISDATILAAMRGSDDAARFIEERISTALAMGFVDGLGSDLWASATLNNGAGQYESALAAGIRAERRHFWGSHIYLPELIEAAARCGQPAAAAAAHDSLVESTDASGTEWALGIQRRCQALRADGLAAEDLYLEAIERLTRTTLRPDLARAHLLYGEWLRRENRRVDARRQLRTAHDMFTAMGMRAFSERARHERLATGETVRKRTPDSFDELTPQEAHIARLAAEGRTNPEIGSQLFISPRTVEWHLRKVFTKLNVASRRELLDALPRGALS